MADRMILENAIKVFEKKFHCSLCLHDYSGMLDHTFLPAMHLNCFCSEVKRSATHGHIQCKCFDIITLQQHLLRVRKSFFKQCAAGAVEAVFPVMLENSVAGAVFAGVFSSLPPEKDPHPPRSLRQDIVFPPFSRPESLQPWENECNAGYGRI